MKAEYKRDYRVTYTEVDKNTYLSLPNALSLVQNTMTEYFESFGSDNIVLKKENSAIWGVSKAKMHFNKIPQWRDLLRGRSYTTKVKPIRVELETTFTDENDEIWFSVAQETCVIDLTTRKIRKVNSVNYPENMETENSVIEDNYKKLNQKFDEADFVYKQKIFSTDIDYSKHTNNVMYTKYIINSLGNDVLDKIQITDFEIHYINESVENQVLKIYKKELANEIEFLIKEENEDKEIVRANLKYKKCGENNGI